MAKEQPVITSRLGRLSLLGRLAGGIAGAVVSEGAKQLAQGQRPSMSDLLLTTHNAQKLADRLSEMRGAAMKVGQLLSMDSGHLLPPQLSELLARLRENAHPMPLGQVAQVLTHAWGKGWEDQFKRFIFKPIAAASIGQVHKAILRDGRHLAVKIQYPGIGRSIDSDVDNVATLLRLTRMIPEEIEFAPVLEEAKKQLHAEADYQQEATALTQYAAHVANDTRFVVPEVVEQLTTSEVMAMSYLHGQPIESLADLSSKERNTAATALLELALREVFDWGLVQTDPNFANYLYEPASGRILLLDFGATRSYQPQQRIAFGRLLHACVEGDDIDIAHCAIPVGYLAEGDPAAFRSFVVKLLHTVTEPVTAGETYTFGQSDLAQRMSEILVEMRLRSRFGRLPPPEVLFLHRKLGGLYLLLTRLRVTLPVRQLIKPYLAKLDSSHFFQCKLSRENIAANTSPPSPVMAS